MRTSPSVFAMLLVATLTTAISTSLYAADYTLSSVRDASIQDSPSAARNSTFNGTGLFVGQTSVDGVNNRWHSLFQFDFTGVPNNEVITGARIEFYDLGTGPNQGGSYAHETYFITPDQTVLQFDPAALTYLNSDGQVAIDSTGIQEDYLTYNALYMSGTGAARNNWAESPVSVAQSLDISIPANNPAGQYFSSGGAAAETLDALNLANQNEFAVVMAWRSAGIRFFGDHESGFAPRLILTTSTIGDFNDSGFIDLGDYFVLLANMQGHLDSGLNPITHGHGDINFDGKVDLDDFGLFKSIYPGGASALAADLAAVSVPEPSTFVLIGMAGFLALARRRSR